MRLTNKSITRSIKKNLREMAMDKPPGADPDPGIEDKLSRGETPFDKVDFPEPEGGGPETNFEEILASARYKDVVEKVRQYTGREVSVQGMEGLMPLQHMMLQSYQNIAATERQHRAELEQLAIEVVMEEMKIPEGSFQWDVKIVGMGEVDMSQMKMGDDEQDDEEGGDDGIANEIEIAVDLEQLDLEKAKRRLINSIVQGSSINGYYMYHNVADRIQQITGSDSIIRDYGIMMSINDLNYWQAPDQTLDAAMRGGGAAGSEEIDPDTDPPTIKARGVNFPALVHELIKGVMEVFSIKGLPQDGATHKKVVETEDLLEKEVWDLRLGPSIWNRLRATFPEDILVDENKQELQNYLLVAIFKLEARDFLVFMKEILSGSERGQNMVNQLVEGVRASLNPEEDNTADIVELQNEVQEAGEETTDDELNEYLREIGIGQNDTEPEGDGNLSDDQLTTMGLNALNNELNKAIDTEDYDLARRIQQMMDRKTRN